jgi:HK97 family phage prohead protease
VKIQGYASTERLDRTGEIIKRDAFLKSLQDYLNAGGVILYNHDRDKVIGKALETRVDNKGLFVIAEIFTDDVEILKAITEGALKSFSVGFISNTEGINENGETIYKEGDLLEISVVSVPANPEATFEILQEDNKQIEETKQAEETRKKRLVFKEAISEEKIKTEVRDMEKINVKEIVDILNTKEPELETKEVEVETVKEAKEVEKEAKLIEKAVNTLGTSTQYATTDVAKVFDGISDGKLYVMPNQIIEMQATTVQIPVLGEAMISTAETGAGTDSDIGTKTITLNAQQFTGRYPLSYLLEMAGGQSLIDGIRSNLKKSIARKFDQVAYALLEATTNGDVFAFDNSVKAADFYTTVLATAGEIVDNPQNCGIVVNPLALAWFVAQPEFLTIDKFGVNAVVNTGVLGKLFGMDVYSIPTDEEAPVAIVLNKDYVASGMMGDIVYLDIIDNTGTTYIIAKALLAFGAELSGVYKFTPES